jgi:hypothetical protein
MYSPKSEANVVTSVRRTLIEGQGKKSAHGTEFTGTERRDLGMEAKKLRFAKGKDNTYKR